MIRYALRCRESHEFESWFRSAQAYDTLRAASGVLCPFCGSAQVEKAPMAPALNVAGERPLTSGPQTDAERALAEMRRAVEENSEYVGLNFATEARSMHEGDSPARAIWGEAHAEEARRLIEEGVPVAPLPFMPPRRSN